MSASATLAHSKRTIAVVNPVPDLRMTISELSALVGRHNAKQTDASLMFPDVLPPVIDDLESVLASIASQGYSVADPVQHKPSRRANHREWHVRVKCPKWEGVLSFCVAVKPC